MTSKNHMVTCLNTVGYVFGHFWKTEIFSVFFWIFSSLDPPVCTSHFFSKKLPQNKFRTSLDAIRNRFGHFRNIETFHIFHLFFPRTSRVHRATILPKKFPRNMFKTCLIAFGNVFGHSQNVKVFPASWSCSKFWHSWVHWALFFRESYLKTSSKQVWTLLGTFLDTFEISKVRFFFIFLHFSTLQGMMISKNHLVTCLNTVGYVFGHFWKTEIFSIFFEFFQVSTLQCVLAISFRKNYLKTSSEQVWTLLGTVLDTLEILKLSIFSIFSSLEPPGCTEQQFYRKKFLETCSKHVWLLLGTFLGILKNWKFFQFLEVFPSFESPGCTGQIFFRENYLKTSSNLFGHF